MKAFVVDTNVGVVANGRETDASRDCIVAAIDFLVGLMEGDDKVVLDDGWEILGEYVRRLESSGQPGPGDAFLKWILQNLATSERCERVKINRIADERRYEEFPDDPELRAFDPDDRMFVAVALTSSLLPSIVNAVDSDWWIFRDQFARNGVSILWICEDQIPLWERKTQLSV